nr:hypothetical protein [Pandoravirus massiliensis]
MPRDPPPILCFAQREARHSAAYRASWVRPSFFTKSEKDGPRHRVWPLCAAKASPSRGNQRPAGPLSPPRSFSHALPRPIPLFSRLSQQPIDSTDMTSFDLGAFEAAIPPTGFVPGYAAGAPTTTRPQTAPPGVYQHITVLNMSGRRATGLWTTDQETSHFTIEDGHIFNVRRQGVAPIRTITISTGGAQPAYSNTAVTPGATIGIVLNKDGGYSPLSTIDGTDNGGGSGSANNNGGGNGSSNGGGDGNGGGYAPPADGNNGYGSERRGLGAIFGISNGGAGSGTNNNNGNGGYTAERRGLAAIFGAPRNNSNGNYADNNGALSFAPFGWRV